MAAGRSAGSGSAGSDRSGGDGGLSRRGFLAACSTAALAGAVAAPASAQSEGADVRPDFGTWLDGVDGGLRDARGQDEVVVQVGASGNGADYAFAPAGLWVDPGTTVRWRWTGNGGSHNVHAQRGADFESETTMEAGHTFEHTFESGGITTYQCDPHAQIGMKGAIAVGDEVPTVAVGAGGPVLPGGDVGIAFVGLSVLTVALAVLPAIGGDVYGAVASRRRGDGSSALAAAAGAGLLGTVLLVAILARLLVG